MLIWNLFASSMLIKTLSLLVMDLYSTIHLTFLLSKSPALSDTVRGTVVGNVRDDYSSRNSETGKLFRPKKEGCLHVLLEVLGDQHI